MPAVYIISNFGKLYRKGETLVFENDRGTTTIFPFRTDSLIFIGKVDITAPALSLIMKHQIDTIFLSSNGKFNGKLIFSEKKNVFLRLKQYKLFENENVKISFSKEIVKSKIKNQIVFLQKMVKKNGIDKDKVYKLINSLKNLFSYVESSNDIEKIRGYEGYASKEFFSVFGKDIIHDWAKFNGRSRNPPKDNVNAVLSFLYTLLYQRVDSTVESEDLDPYIGMFHEVDYGKRSLSFDLMEEFRTPIAETLTISLFNLSILNKDDFRIVNFSNESIENPLKKDEINYNNNDKRYENINFRDIDENENSEDLSGNVKGVLLNDSGLRKCIEAFEKKMFSTLFYEYGEKTISYQGLIREQIKLYKRFINGEEKSYKGFVYK